MIQKYSDKMLLSETKKIRLIEKQTIHQVLLHLKEIYSRRLYADLNYKSLYEYCIKELRYTSGEAQYRISAVKLMRESKKIEKKIEIGELPLSNAVLIHNHFSKNKHKPSKLELEKTVFSICGKTKSQTKEILEKKENSSFKNDRNEAKRKTARRECRDLFEELLNLEDLDKLKVILKEKIFEAKERLKIKAAKNRRTSPSSQSRYIPTPIKAAIKLRARGKCEHPGCNARRNLEYEHIKPFALGGEHSTQNLKLFCPLHNRRAAIKIFGKNKMSAYDSRMSHNTEP